MFVVSSFGRATYSRSRQTRHARESSVSLVASLSSLTSLSSVSLSSSRTLGRDNHILANLILQECLKIYVYARLIHIANIQQVHGHQQDQRGQQDQRDPKETTDNTIRGFLEC